MEISRDGGLKYARSYVTQSIGKEMKIICHVSDIRVANLQPRPPENAICFSEDKFCSYFGKFLYLFDLDNIKRHFRIERIPTTGVYSSTSVDPEMYNGINNVRYQSYHLGWEWRCYDSIPIEQYAIGVLEHWNHMEGVIGTYTVDEAVRRYTVDLMKYYNGNTNVGEQ